MKKTFLKELFSSEIIVSFYFISFFLSLSFSSSGPRGSFLMAQIPWCLSCPSSPFSTIIFRQKKLFWVTVIATNVFRLDGVGLGESCRRCSAVAATLGWKKYDFDYTHIIKVNRIRLGSQGKEKKLWLNRMCLDDIATALQFSG